MIRIEIVLLSTLLVFVLVQLCAGGIGQTTRCIIGSGAGRALAACNPKSASCKRGDPVRLVIELNDDTENPLFYGFCVKIDQFTLLNLPGSGAYMNKSTNATVTVHIGEDSTTAAGLYKRESSDPRFFMNEDDNSTFVSYYSAVVSLNNGRFRVNSNGTEGVNILWEDSCSADGSCLLDVSKPCVRNSDCGLSSSSITNNFNATGTSQDVKIYLAWEGSARARKALSSAAQLPTRFRAYSFARYFNTLYNLVIPKAK